MKLHIDDGRASIVSLILAQAVACARRLSFEDDLSVHIESDDDDDDGLGTYTVRVCDEKRTESASASGTPPDFWSVHDTDRELRLRFDAFGYIKDDEFIVVSSERTETRYATALYRAVFTPRA